MAVLLGVALAALAAEGLLRTTGAGSPPAVKVAIVDVARDELRFHCYPSNPDGAFDPLPESVPPDWLVVELRDPPVPAGRDALASRPWCVGYTYGRRGVRGPAVPDLPMPWTQRIVGVGDSFAFGEGVRHADTLFARLDRDLGDRIEVVNCARSGADLALDVATLEWAAATLHPARALLVLTPNDIGAPSSGGHGRGGSHDLINVRDTTPGPVAWSRLAGLVHRAATAPARAAATERAYLAAHDPHANPEGLARAAHLLRRVAAIDGVRTAVVVFPLMHRLDDDHPLAPAHERLAQLAADAGLPVLDLLPAFRGHDAATLHVHPTDHHPHARAHGIAADAVARWLRDDVPGFLER